MHPFDIGVGIVAVVFTFLGIRRGLIGEAIRLIAVAGAVALAIVFHDRLSPYLGALQLSATNTSAVAFFAVFLVVLISILLVGWVVQKAVNLTILGWGDKLGGALFGLTKSLVIVWVLVVSIKSAPFTGLKKNMAGSVVYTRLSQVAGAVSLPFIRMPQPGVEAANNERNEKIRKLKDQIDSFRKQVDSAKSEIEETWEQ